MNNGQRRGNRFYFGLYQLLCNASSVWPHVETLTGVYVEMACGCSWHMVRDGETGPAYAPAKALSDSRSSTLLLTFSLGFLFLSWTLT